MHIALSSGKSGPLETWVLVLGYDAGYMKLETSCLCTEEFKHTYKCLWV